jgi:molybdopterin converting factor small subunit
MAPPAERSATAPDAGTEAAMDADTRSEAGRGAGTAATAPATETTTVEVRAVGQLRHDFPEERFEFSFQGDTLRAFVGALLAEHPELADRLVGETRREDDAGWTELRDGTDDRTRPYVRAMVNGTFNEFLEGADTALEPGDEVELVYPLCC